MNKSNYTTQFCYPFLKTDTLLFIESFKHYPLTTISNEETFLQEFPENLKQSILLNS